METKMNIDKKINKLANFAEACAENLAVSIEEILQAGGGHRPCAIGFVTTDDFYGFYLTWDYSSNIAEYYDWEQSLEPDYLYQPLVDVVDNCQEIDFCNPSAEKWEFALAVMTVLAENIKQIPEEVFARYNYRREDVLFFATMSDGDYVEEMLAESVKMFNVGVAQNR